MANSGHPPSSIYHSEVFLSTIANAITTSPRFDKTLFIVNYDEHGGTPDHIAPNWTAVAPDNKSQPGDGGFYFNRFGVRVPLLMISPYIQAGTVFRANSDPFSTQTVPFDHTTILALILDWQNIARTTLSSNRVLAANTALLDQLLALDEPRVNIPLCQPTAGVKQLNTTTSDRLLSSLEKSVIIAYEYYRTWQDGDTLPDHISRMQGKIKRLSDKVQTMKDARDYLKK
ncbi:MAG: hypothetical protein GY821_09165 [Gammaproteobacteria bacterium]|nr:hypothetical protein [Gammaproteobacteria bacterium]